MGKINVLEKHVAELIAAGEVVERPASVIKELVENSIDAGASAVTVEIKQGGITFMRVTDNGCGIAREDVPKAFLRHATSKVKVQDDLDKIATLGFRGEALASVCAVSHVELITRTEEELAGTSYKISGGEEISCEDAGCAQGTTILIRDLFYNTPARMKFLKKDVSEANAVAGIMDRAALSHPEISFRFIRDGKEELNTPGDAQLKSAVYAVYGKEFTSGLIPVKYQLNGVEVWGFISKPSAARPNRSMQHFFINGRYVKTNTARVALEQACKGAIMVGKFPGCVLHLQLSFQAVDVNVHPAKIEVRFVNEKPIFDAVYHGVKSALMVGDTRKEMPLKAPSYTERMGTAQTALPLKPEQLTFLPASGSAPAMNSVQNELPDVKQGLLNIQEKSIHIIEDDMPDVSIPPRVAYTHAVVSDNSDLHAAVYFKSALENKPTASAEQPAAQPQLQESFQTAQNPVQQAGVPVAQSTMRPVEEDLRLIGELFHTYIMVEQGTDELLLIDKHAAHERMLYEKLKKESGKSYAQMLLEPVPVTLNKNEYGVLLQNTVLLDEAGFEIDDFGGGTVLVRSAPLFLEGEDISASVMEIAGYLLAEKSDISTVHLDWLYHNIACRAAIKAGAHSKPQELADLVKRLCNDPSIRYCPHGRPVVVVIKKREIEKQFGRV